MEERTMLVLARKHGQSIFVGEDVEITIVEVRGDVVRLGINAPGGISVYRKEVLERIRAEQAAAGNNGAVATDNSQSAA
jgi:carbon storage regulator